MDHKTFFLKFWEKEAKATREVIARVPQDRSDYRADPKARTAREIAWLIAHEETVLADGLENSRLEWIDSLPPASMPELLSAYDRKHEMATTKLKALEPTNWEGRVPFIWQGQEVMNETAYEMAWGFLLDQIHHRGQLSTYLRPMGAKVPQIYGPSADEP